MVLRNFEVAGKVDTRVRSPIQAKKVDELYEQLCSSLTVLFDPLHESFETSQVAVMPDS